MSEERVSRPDAAQFALFNLGFRPFYLLAALLAAVAVPVWLAQYGGWLPQAGHLSGMAWHAHEMIFGFAAAVITGFLFTAVRNWTGLPTPAGGRLAALALLWIAGRLLVVTGPGALALVVDSGFLAAVALALWVPLRRSRNRNQFFVALLLLMAAANAAFHAAHLGWIGMPPVFQARFALYLVILIIAIMGGRVIPMFTANALPHAKVRQSPGIDRAALGLLVAALFASASGAPPWLSAPLCVAAALAQAWRLWQWDPLATRATPILWVLHLSYAWIPLGLLLLALSLAGVAVPAALALHAFGIGAAGGMIIGMMTRTARGHTGRPLRAGRGETAAYVLVHAAAAARVFGGLLWPAGYAATLLASGLLWSAAFLVFLVVYWPILTRPRADGRPG